MLLPQLARDLLLRGNDKLGAAVWQFNLPAGKTCPGESSLCAGCCYAKRYAKRFTFVDTTYADLLALSRRKDFASILSREIIRKDALTVRVHASGDFYSPGYVRKWIKVARRCPLTRFYWYTRSWRVPRIFKELQEFARLPNVSGWISVDRETGMPADTKGFRVAYMAMDSSDTPPDGVDLVFKVRGRREKTIRMGGVLVCPVENGAAVVRTITCTQCKLCFRDRSRSRM